MPGPAHFPRRTLLRGAGAAVALPWLEIMGRDAAAGSAAARPPVRLGFFYVPNGVHMDHWRPGAEGPLGELPPILRPLEPHKRRIVVVSNLAANHCNGDGAAHEPAGGGFLVGHRCKHSEVPEVGGVSVDQLAAAEIGLSTPVDSLALGIDPGHRGDHGYSGTYMSHISWRTPTTPTPLELNPRQLHDRLFRDRPLRRPRWDEAPAPAAAADTVETSVLDLVREETRAVQRRLGFRDRRRLEDYLEGLRGVERRIARAEGDAHSHHEDAFAADPAADAALDDPALPKLVIPDGRGIPSVYADHVDLMFDILALAFQTDATRVASFMFSYEKSGRSYAEINAPGAHHSTSHHGGKAENHEQLSRINAHHMERFARLLGRLAAIEEGEGTLLDNVVFCYGSGISDGNRHNHDDLPILLAGGGGSLAGGRHLVAAPKTPLCNLYLDMLARCGAPRERFGDSTGPLAGLGS